MRPFFALIVLILSLFQLKAFAAPTLMKCSGGSTLNGTLLKLEAPGYFFSGMISFADRLPSDFTWTGEEPKVTSEEIGRKLESLGINLQKIPGVFWLAREPAMTFTAFDAGLTGYYVDYSDKLYVETALLEGSKKSGLVIFSSLVRLAGSKDLRAMVVRCSR